MLWKRVVETPQEILSENLNARLTCTTGLLVYKFDTLTLKIGNID